MSTSKRIVLVEDEPVIRANYSDLLKAAGFHVDTFANRKETLAAFDRVLPDLALLDISLGEEQEGGFLICQELRRRSPNVPIIFLTSHDDDIDRISSFRLGADDYLTKDISVRFLVVRIQALLERIRILQLPATVNNAATGILRCGSLEIDNDQLRVSWRQQPVELTLTQLWILSALAATPGVVKSVAELMDAANTQVQPNTITAQVNRIRKRFQEMDADFDLIENVHGHGYRWRER